MAMKKRAKRARGRVASKPAAKGGRSRAKPAPPATRARKKATPRAGARRPAARRPAPSPPAPAAPRNAIGAVHQHLDFTTHALEEVQRFYTEVLGFADFQLDPSGPYLSVRTGPGSSLGFMPPVPGPPEQWRPPREPALYLHVEDVDRAYRALLARGITFVQEPTDMPWKHRVAVLRDPEGRTIALAQLKSR